MKDATDVLRCLLDETERRIKALEHLTEGMLLAEAEMEERISLLERKLNHRGER